jgi:hypothetical protein
MGALFFMDDLHGSAPEQTQSLPGEATTSFFPFSEKTQGVGLTY